MKQPKPRTVSQERAYVELMTVLDETELWLRNDRLKERLIPADWHRIEAEVPVRRKKTKLTAAFDDDVVKWFRGLGLGYQARMNAVLRSFMLAVVSKEITGRGDYDWKRDPL